MFLPYELRGEDGSAPPTAGPVVRALVGLCVITFVVQLLTGDAFTYRFGFLPGAGNRVALVSHMFLHGGVGHLVGNMVFLHAFGRRLEYELGSWRFLVLYMVSGLGAVTVYSLAEGLPLFERVASVPVLVEHGVHVLVGASGAISGVMAAVLLWHPTAMVAVMWWFPPFVWGETLLVPAWVLILLGFLGDLTDILSRAQTGVAHWAHLGGAGAGLFLASQLGRERRWRPGRASEVNARPGWLFQRARRLYLHGQPLEALRVLGALREEGVPPELARPVAELQQRILRQMGLPW